MFRSFRAKLGWLVLIIVILFCYIVIAKQITPFSRSAFINNTVVEISPEVSGQVTEVFKANNAFVKKGQPLFQIQKQPYELKVAALESQLSLVISRVEALRVKIKQAEQDLLKNHAILKKSQQYYYQIQQTYKKGAESLEKLQLAQERLQVAKVAVTKAEEQLRVLQDTLGTDIGGVNVHVRQAQANLNTAKFYLHKTTVLAPADGYFENQIIKTGSYVTPQTKIPFVPTKGWWIEAYFDENSFAKLTVGQPALVSLDLYPGRLFEARVTLIGHGILTKAKQSVYKGYLPMLAAPQTWFTPHRILPIGLQLLEKPKFTTLRVGASVNVVVLTRQDWFWNGLARFWIWLTSYFNYI